MEIQQALQILDQVVHNEQLRFLTVKEAVMVENALTTIIKMALQPKVSDQPVETETESEVEEN